MYASDIGWDPIPLQIHGRGQLGLLSSSPLSTELCRTLIYCDGPTRDSPRPTELVERASELEARQLSVRLKESPVGETKIENQVVNTLCIHVFARLYAQSVFINKISASVLNWKFIKSTLLVG